MNLHEYQSKQIFVELRHSGAAGPRCELPPMKRRSGARAIGGTLWVVKAQVHAGGRGKAGGVKLAKRPRGSARRRGGNARQAPRHTADRPGRPAGRQGLRRVGLADRARAVPQPGAQSRTRPHRLHRLGGRRHGHRGSRRPRAGEDPHGHHPSGGGPAGLPVPAARLRARASRASRSSSSRRSRRRCTGCIWTRTRAWSRSIR